MNLRESLNKMSSYAGKTTYEELIKRLEDVAKSGKDDLYIDYDEVLLTDIEKLKAEELTVKRLEGEKYSYNGCWHISW